MTPRGIAFDVSSPPNLWVSDSAGSQNNVKEYDSNGNYLGVKINNSTSQPWGLDISSANYIYVVMNSAGSVEKYDHNGTRQGPPYPWVSGGGLNLPYYDVIHTG